MRLEGKSVVVTGASSGMGKAIRAMERPDAKSIPIVAMTASAFTEEINRCKEVGMNEHLAKPLDIEKLISTVARYVKQK